MGRSRAYLPRVRRERAPPTALRPLRRRRRNRFRTLLRIALLALPVLVLLPALPWLTVALFVDVDTLRTQVEAAARLVTGRTLSLGRVTMLRSLPPTFAAEDVTFANAPGGSRPDMLRIPYVEATLGILPLLAGRLDITALLLSRPDLVLEADAADTGNWKLAPLPADLLPAGTPLSARPRWARRHAAQARAAVTLEQLHIREGRLAWRNDAGDWTSVEVRRLDAAAPGMAERGVLTAQLLHADRLVGVTLNTGPLGRLRDPAGIAPWPLDLEIETPGAHARIAGTLTRPAELRGYALAVEGAAENLGELQDLLHVRLPPLRKLAFQTHLADSGGAVPTISGISVRARESNLDAWVPGLQLAALDLAADSFDHPVQAELEGMFDHRPLHLAAALGAPASLLSPGRIPGRLPVELDILAAGAELAVKGAIAAPERGTGLDLDISGTIPDLGLLSPLLGFRLPGFRDITLGLHAGDAEGGFRNGLAIRNIAIHSSEADLAGELDLPFAGPAPVRAVLTGRSLDIDALGAAMGAAMAAGAAPPNEPGGMAGGWLIPTGRLPLAWLTRNAFDLRATIARLQLGGTPLHDVTAVARLHDGVLTVDPLAATLPGGGLELTASLDGHGRFPPASVSLLATGLPARPVFGALGLPDDVTGTITVTASLRSAGASWHELASALSGQLGFAMSDAELDNRLLELVFGPALRVAGLAWPGTAAPGTPGHRARTPARCLTLRLDASAGLATLRSVVLDTPGLLLQVDGALQLRDERIALRLRPTAPGAGQHATAVRIGGVFSRTTIYPEQRAPEAEAPPASGPAPDVCAEALATARAVLPGLAQP
jgi:AsmA protein